MAGAQAVASDTLAPWAEAVPGTSLMTTADLLALPDDGWQYELVEGRLVRMPPSGLESSSIGIILGAALLAFVRPRRLGIVTGEQGGYALGPRTDLVPDVGFIRAERAPSRTSRAFKKLAPVAPDLAVEVASPHQYRPGIAKKAQYYLNAGTQLVWIVWPTRQQIDIWEPGDTGPRRTLNVGDMLDGGDVLPGFTYPVADIFA